MPREGERVNVEEFVLMSLPRARCRVLEVGCGAGDLARFMAGRGYEVTAIDPDAPEGKIFRKVKLEEFDDDEPFDAVVANKSLHHIHDLIAALEKIQGLLLPGGPLILNEFGWEQMDSLTARWYVAHLRRPPGQAPISAGDFLSRWIAEHEHFHTSVAMREALDTRFTLKVFEWVPYMASGELERPELVEDELSGIRAGTINAIGFRYVGTRRQTGV
jgi:SAM-dependent methyltransferase